METVNSGGRSLHLEHLQGLERGYTRFLRVDPSDTSNFRESRDALRRWMGGINFFDVVHLGGITGTSKDGPADLMAHLLEQMDGSGRTLQFFSSGNTDLAIKHALVRHDIRKVLLHAYVNKGINPLILERIEDTVDQVTMLNGQSPPPFENLFGDINPDIAHARHIYQAVLAGLRPDSIFVPVGSGSLATEIIEASSGWVSIAKYLDSVGIELSKDMFDEIYPKIERCTNLDRQKETVGFGRFIEYMQRKHPNLVPERDQLEQLVPNIYLCGEEGLLLSNVKYDSVRAKWKIAVDIDGESNESYAMVTGKKPSDVIADKLFMRRILHADLRNLTGAMNLRPHHVKPLAIPSFKIMEANAHAHSAGIPCEPTSSITLAGLREVVREDDCRGKNLGEVWSINSGKGRFPIPGQTEERVSEENKPFRGWVIR